MKPKRARCPGLAESTPAKRGRGARSANGKIQGLTLEQHRCCLGDKVKASIQVEKWTIEARTHIIADMAIEVFCALVVPHAASVVPSSCAENDPMSKALHLLKRFVARVR